MPSPSSEIIRLFSAFAIAFTAPTFANVMVLVCGSILAPGRRTVAAALRIMGLSFDSNYGKYHRVLSRAKWSSWLLSKLLLALIITCLLAAGAPLLLAIDDTLERRKGGKLKLRGWFRDPLTSSRNKTNKVSAIRWVCLAILVAVPWSKRLWALPFMTVPAPSEKTCQKLGKRHRPPVELAAVMIALVRRWHPQQELVLLADGGYAAVSLVHDCQKLGVTLISRLRIDACLYDFPLPSLPARRGPKAKKGARQASLKERLVDPTTTWTSVSIPWYGGDLKHLELSTGVSLWHRTGHDPVVVRWVLLRCPEESFAPCACFASGELPPVELLSLLVLRWNLEVTFEELRAQLGFETQRGWADKTIERTTPCLFGSFSLVVLLAKRLHPQELPVQQASWYDKQEATFSDALAAVRHHLWTHQKYLNSTPDAHMQLIPQPLWNSLLQAVCYST